MSRKRTKIIRKMSRNSIKIEKEDSNSIIRDHIATNINKPPSQTTKLKPAMRTVATNFIPTSVFSNHTPTPWFLSCTFTL